MGLALRVDACFNVGSCCGCGYDYDGGVDAVASAMAEESEGEAMGASGRVQGVGGATWRSSSPSSGEAASRRWRTAVRARRARARPPGKGGRRQGRWRWWAGPVSYSVGPVGGLHR